MTYALTGPKRSGFYIPAAARVREVPGTGAGCWVLGAGHQAVLLLAAAAAV